MNKSSLGKHQVKLSVQARPGLLDCCRVDKAGYGPLDFSQIPTGNNSRWLIVNSNLFSIKKIFVQSKICKSLLFMI